MPANHNEIEKRLWDAADELRANSILRHRWVALTQTNMHRSAALLGRAKSPERL